MKRLVLVLLVTACGGGTQLPKGPPPEYEEEPGMSQPQPDAAPPPAIEDAGAAG